MSDLPPCETDSFDRCFERALGSPITWRITAVVVLAFLALSAAHGRDIDGRYAQSPNHEWFKSLHSKRGYWCCDMSDGRAVADVDWQTHDGHYQVKLDGQWVDVPEDAVITEPNKDGRTIVWPGHQDGKPSVNCFMPGSMT